VIGICENISAVAANHVNWAIIYFYSVAAWQFFVTACSAEAASTRCINVGP